MKAIFIIIFLIPIMIYSQSDFEKGEKEEIGYIEFNKEFLDNAKIDYKTTVRFTGITVDIYPNPISNPFTLNLHDFKADRAQILIYNKVGQTLYSKNVALINGIAQLKIPSGSWARGIYIVEVKAADKIVRKPVMR